MRTHSLRWLLIFMYVFYARTIARICIQREYSVGLKRRICCACLEYQVQHLRTDEFLDFPLQTNRNKFQPIYLYVRHATEIDSTDY